MASLIAIFVGLLLVIFTNSSALRKPYVALGKPSLIPPQQLEYFTFGYQEMIADLLWLRSIQSFDFCGENFLGEEVELGDNRFRLCQQGWVYQMLDAATRISPRYRIIYTRGAIGLSVIVNDREGANKLYDRGTEKLPGVWSIHYQSSFHKLFEMKDTAGAAEQMKLASEIPGAPDWLAIAAARLYNESGQAEFGLQALVQFYGETPFEEWPERARERWQELETKLGRKVRPPQPKK